MGLATIDPHSHKVQTKVYKVPKFGVNRPNSKQDMSKFTKKCMATGHSVRMAIHFRHLCALSLSVSLNSCQYQY